MSRPIKPGIDYFPLDVALDEKFELIEAEFGLIGFGVVVKLYQKIYGQGYYIEWTDEVALLFAKRIGLGGGAVSEIINASIRRGIFDKGLFQKHRILTSAGIQKRYFEAVSRRKQIQVRRDYLLIEVAQICKDAHIYEENAHRNHENVDDNPQRKEKKRKEEDCAFFDSLWQLYPNKRGKGQVSESQKAKLERIGYAKLKRCIDRYLADLAREEWRKPQNGSTFFNSGYVDYLDENYAEPAPPGDQWENLS